MRKIYILLIFLGLSGKVFSQPAGCVHGSGITYLLDAFLASIGACNCQKAHKPIYSMPSCNEISSSPTFEDNFDGNSLDLSKWEIQPWGQGALSGPDTPNLEYNSLDNVEVSNGTLKITAKQETERQIISEQAVIKLLILNMLLKIFSE